MEVEVIEWEIEEREVTVEKVIFVDVVKEVIVAEEVPVEYITIVPVDEYVDIKVNQVKVVTTTVDRVIEKPCAIKIVENDSTVEKQIFKDKIELQDEIVKIDVVQEIINEVEQIVEKPTVKIIEKEKLVTVQEIKVQE